MTTTFSEKLKPIVGVALAVSYLGILIGMSSVLVMFCISIDLVYPEIHSHPWVDVISVILLFGTFLSFFGVGVVAITYFLSFCEKHKALRDGDKK